MNIEDIRLLYEYNNWANARIMAAAAQVTAEQFVADADHSHGGLRGTLVHTLDADYGWRMLLQHNARTPVINETDFPTLADLATRWQDEERDMRAYLAGLQDEDLLAPIRFTADSGAQRERLLWHCLLHVVNHGTQHRSEAAALLTNLGQSPGDVDFTLFLSSLD